MAMVRMPNEAHTVATDAAEAGTVILAEVITTTTMAPPTTAMAHHTQQLLRHRHQVQRHLRQITQHSMPSITLISQVATLMLLMEGIRTTWLTTSTTHSSRLSNQELPHHRQAATQANRLRHKTNIKMQAVLLFRHLQELVATLPFLRHLGCKPFDKL